MTAKQSAKVTRALKLVANGMTAYAAAKRVGVALSTIYRAQKRERLLSKIHALADAQTGKPFDLEQLHRLRALLESRSQIDKASAEELAVILVRAMHLWYPLQAKRR